MLKNEDIEILKEKYESIIWKYSTVKTSSLRYPNVALKCKKRFKTLNTELGFIHAYNNYSFTLSEFCTSFKKIKCPKLSENFIYQCKKLKFKNADKNDFQQFEEQLSTQHEFYRNSSFIQIENFLQDFRYWINGQFENDKTKMYLEPFQKTLLMHVIFFIAVTKLPNMANHITRYLTQTFDVNFFTESNITILKQKASVFLVPRRHGKTWFIVQIICFLLKNIYDINIGYVAHQKHVSQFVMKEVEFKCRRIFPYKEISRQENVITVGHIAQKSTALFASCYNTHVSIFKQKLIA